MGKRGRPQGSGRLSLEAQKEVIRAILSRKQLTYRALAKKLNATESSIRCFASRIQRKGLVKLDLTLHSTEGSHGEE